MREQATTNPITGLDNFEGFLKVIQNKCGIETSGTLQE
jgi:hypothetical protein